MDRDLAETIRARIALLASERERHAQRAQREDYGYAAAIGELEQLLGALTAPAPAIEEGEANAAAS